MKRIYPIAAVLSMVVLGARAQDEEALKAKTVQAQLAADQAKLQARKAELQALEWTLQDTKVYAVSGAVMGATVKNAPYSAVEVTETTQVLVDGNRIHRENQTTVYRDSEGRVRRETPNQVTIWDPVANTSYNLNPRTQVATKLPLGVGWTSAVYAGDPGGAFVSVQSPVPIGEGIRIVVPPTAEGAGRGPAPVLTYGGRGARGGRGPASGKTESLGKQSVEGVLSDGTRTSSTIEAGAIGNERPIQVISESWYSPELQTLVKSVHTDPRNGEEIFRLTNVSRVEPPSILFQVPADYQVVGRK